MSNAKLHVARGGRDDVNNNNNEQPVAEVPKRLVVELSRRTAADLAWLVEEEEMNKTTLVNRAVQLYKLIVETQRNGAAVYFEDPQNGKIERLVIV